MKKLKDTKVGAWLKSNAPKVLDAVDDFLPPVKILTALVKGENIPDEKLLEFEKLAQEYDKEVYALEIQDRENARGREVELAKAGGNDHMMYVAGYTALGTFVLMVVSVIFRGEYLSHNPLFHQLMGIIEGVALSVFGYYFGATMRERKK